MMKIRTGSAIFMDIDKPHVLVYRGLGMREHSIKGFDSLNELRTFIDEFKDEITIVKRLEEGK